MLHLNEHLKRAILMPPDCIKAKDSKVSPDECDATMGIEFCKSAETKMNLPGQASVLKLAATPLTVCALRHSLDTYGSCMSSSLTGLSPSMAAAIYMRIATVRDPRR